MSVVLVIAPHPDDETLGCGGTLLRHCAEGDQIHWLVVTQLDIDRHSVEKVQRRRLEIQRVTSAYGFTSTIQLGFETARLDRVGMDEIVSGIGEVVATVKPEVIYLPFPGDAHTDHRIVYHAAAASTKWFRYPSVRRVMACEILSETDFGLAPDSVPFKPNSYVDIGPWLEEKVRIMSLYSGEMAPHPFPRSEAAIRALALLRGAQCGVEAAEAFIVLKEVK
jgi:LmbE family N-acetylglucosaminyl deacetylase